MKNEIIMDFNYITFSAISFITITITTSAAILQQREITTIRVYKYIKHELKITTKAILAIMIIHITSDSNKINKS